MKKLSFVSVLTVIIATSFAVNSFAEDFYVVPTMKKNYTPVQKTGQATFYRIGDDGDLEKGVAWPNPRFTKNGDGTVTDNLTGLVWLENANCFGTKSWTDALSFCNSLASGSCGLTDGSSAGDWRLPNRFELESLLDMGYFDPSISNTSGTAKWSSGDPFDNVQSGLYWSSTTDASYGYSAYAVEMDDGDVDSGNKGSTIVYFWPVRDDN